MFILPFLNQLEDVFNTSKLGFNYQINYQIHHVLEQIGLYTNPQAINIGKEYQNILKL